MLTSHSLRRTLTISGLLLALVAVLILSTASFARAKDRDDDNDRNEHQAIEQSNEFSRDLLGDRATNTPATIFINKQGKATVSAGEVTESSWPNLKVKAWGTVFSVHVMPDARIIGATNTGTTTPLVTVAVGDKVDFIGDVELATGLIHAKSFRNRSAVNQQSNDIQSRIKALMQQIEQLRAQLKDMRKSTGGAVGRALWN